MKVLKALRPNILIFEAYAWQYYSEQYQSGRHNCGLRKCHAAVEIMSKEEQVGAHVFSQLLLSCPH
jgi:hypothetical protein